MITRVEKSKVTTGKCSNKSCGRTIKRGTVRGAERVVGTAGHRGERFFCRLCTRIRLVEQLRELHDMLQIVNDDFEKTDYCSEHLVYSCEEEHEGKKVVHEGDHKDCEPCKQWLIDNIPF